MSSGQNCISHIPSLFKSEEQLPPQIPIASIMYEHDPFVSRQPKLDKS